MSEIRERLRKSIEEQRRFLPEGATGQNDGLIVEVFRPVREAAMELRDELSHAPDMKIEITPSEVRIDLYDKHFWFGYDAGERIFVGTEQDTRWMEGGLRETPYRWDSADACIEAMIQACARYVLLAEATNQARSGR